MSRISGAVHVFHAHHTVILQLALCARVVSFLHHGEAALTLVAVEEVVTASNSTDAAPFAVEDLLPFVVIVEQIADAAEVPGELDFTLFAGFLWLLNCVTVVALDLLDVMTIKLVVLLWIELVLIFHLVMAESAGKELIACGALFLASSSVVLAAKLCFILSLFYFFSLS